MSDVELKLSLEEAVAITNLIGSLPTSQGAWPLFEKLKAQVEPHLPKAEEENDAGGVPVAIYRPASG
jgi:hypothetical protein